MKHIFKHIAGCVLLSIIIFGCKKEDAYKDFVKDGAIIYPGKPLDLKALGGKNRAKLSWVVIDAKVSRFVIHWNNRLDSLEMPAVNTGETADSVSVIIENLPENNYIFEIVSYDRNGNRSIKEEVAAKVYGDEFIGALLNRPIKRAGSMSGTAEVYWGTPEQNVDAGIIVSSRPGWFEVRSTDEIAKIEVTDVLGRSIYKSSAIDARIYEANLPTSNAVVLIRISLSNGKTIVKKVRI
ncbi:MAG: hypothetical protein EOO94_01650 [Pedobacter sp.]|nr:MAG: hypothetical protein EOO94_01650 [Pedobacter sp.]